MIVPHGEVSRSRCRFHRMKVIAAAALAAVSIALGPTRALGSDALDVVSQYQAVWNSPSAGTPSNTAVDGPLLGNGDMLATFAGPPQNLVFYLSKNDFWRLQQGNGNSMPLPVGTLSLQCSDLVNATYQVTQDLSQAVTHGVFTTSNGTLRMDARVLAEENLLLIGLSSDTRTFQVSCGLAVPSGHGSVSSAGTTNGVPWIERAFPSGTVDIPTQADCGLAVLGPTVASSGLPTATQFGTYNVNLGREQWSGGPRWGFAGAIDELTVYQVALTPDEIASLYGGTVPQRGLLQYWSMDTLPPNTTNATTVPGHIGSATQYQGSATSYSNIGSTSMPLDVVSMGCWINIGSTQTANYILSCGEWNQGVSLGLSGGAVRFSINGTYVQTAVLPTGQWIHVAATAANGTMAIWLNGVLAVGSGAQSQSVTAVVQPGTTTWLAVSMDSLFKSNTPRDTVVARCNNLSAGDLNGLINSHNAWWASYWNQSWIEIGDPVLEKAYYLSYYGTASCSRDPDFPPGIFGWVTTDSPNWFGDYHLNYNFQAPFYALASGNRLDQLTPHDAPILAFLSRGESYANAIFGTGPRGVIYPVGIGPMGIDTTYNSGIAYPNSESGVETWGQRSNAAYALLNMAEHWRMTYDPNYGAKIYPFAKQVAAFWESYLTDDGTRYKDVGDSIQEGSGPDVNPILSLGLLRNAFDLALDLSYSLGVDPDKQARWQDILGRLSGYTTQTQSGQVVFRYSESGTAWWSGNTLGIQHIYPAGALDLDSDPTSVGYGLDTIDVMQRWFDTNGSNSFFPAAVRIGYEPRVILANLRTYAGQMNPNGFQQNNPHGIENLSTTPSSINEMLCMSHVALGYVSPAGAQTPRIESLIRVFGSWPRECDAHFVNLRAWGGFLVSSSLWAGDVQYVEIFSERGHTSSMRNPWPGQQARLYRNGVASEVVSGDIFSFPTSQGETITVLPGPYAMPSLGVALRKTDPINRGGQAVGNLSFNNGPAQWAVSGGTSTFVETGSSTATPPPDGNAIGLRADVPGAPITISQSVGAAVAGTYVVSYWVADRIAEHWLNYKVELLAGQTVILSRDSATDPSVTPPNGSTSSPSTWGRGAVEGSWYHVRLQATIPPSLAGQPLTIRFTSTTQSVGDNGTHYDFALDAVQLTQIGSSSWPLVQQIQNAQRQADGSTQMTVNWLSSPGTTYRVETTGDFSQPWTSVQTNLSATPPVNSVTLQFPASANNGFLRVVGW